MLPVLLDLRFFKIYTFGVFLVLAFFWGSFLLWKNIRLTSYKEEDIFDGVFLSLFGALFGGRLIYVILNFKNFGFDLVKFFLINGYPGLSLIGALIGGFCAMAFILHSKKIKVQHVIDYFVSPLFLAIAFGKLGSFFGGTEVGTKTKLFLSIRYAGFDGMRHLTAFYEALAFFFGAFIAYRLLFEIRKERYGSGFLGVLFVWYFGLVYFVFDKIMDHSLYFLGYRFNKLVAVILLLTSSAYFIYYFRSLIFKKMVSFSNYLRHYGQKTYQNIHQRTKRKTHS